jgi:ribosome-binding protein aMBF1 (putative translation factor)
MSLTRHCWNCGTEYKLSGSPGRSETCEHCGADLKVCLNCVSYDARAAYQCRDRRAEPVEAKGAANYCEYFDMARREFVKKDDAFSADRETVARDVLKKLLGD